jgi:hypothetical protein
MDEFIPSEDFVERTMKRVNEVSITQGPMQFSATLRFNNQLIQFGYLAAAVVFGLINLARLYFGVFAPVSCH